MRVLLLVWSSSSDSQSSPIERLVFFQCSYNNAVSILIFDSNPFLALQILVPSHVQEVQQDHLASSVYEPHQPGPDFAAASDPFREGARLGGHHRRRCRNRHRRCSRPRHPEVKGVRSARHWSRSWPNPRPGRRDPDLRSAGRPHANRQGNVARPRQAHCPHCVQALWQGSRCAAFAHSALCPIKGTQVRARSWSQAQLRIQEVSSRLALVLAVVCRPTSIHAVWREDKKKTFRKGSPDLDVRSTVEYFLPNRFTAFALCLGLCFRCE